MLRPPYSHIERLGCGVVTLVVPTVVLLYFYYCNLSSPCDMSDKTGDKVAIGSI